jgi:periplasmic divalent cation tolerance protein
MDRPADFKAFCDRSHDSRPDAPVCCLGFAGCGTAMSSPTLLVLTTCGNAADAGSLAALLVEQRLAACVNALDKVTSTYRWQGRVQQDQETLLVIRTTAARYPAVEKAIRAHSKYELPEVLAIPVAAGSSAYLDWVRESVAGNED